MSELLKIFSLETGLAEVDLIRIIHTAPRRYRTYKIQKRSGGEREIAQPSRELKLLQYVLLEHVLNDLPVHDAAHAYKKGVSIKDNASSHAGHGPILKMDFKDFFPSIRSEDWQTYCKERDIFDEEDRRISSLVLFRQIKGERLLKLSIGAPSSPALSNALLYKFDTIIQSEASSRKINYTRYADDITFSGQRIGMLRDMIKIVEHAVRQIHYPRLTINESKTVFVTTSMRRTVTGLTLANDGTVTLGRERKRLISAQVHHATLKKLSLDQLRSLAGMLAFVNAVEPSFLETLSVRYGKHVIAGIMRSANSKVD